MCTRLCVRACAPAREGDEPLPISAKPRRTTWARNPNGRLLYGDAAAASAASTHEPRTNESRPRDLHPGIRRRRRHLSSPKDQGAPRHWPRASWAGSPSLAVDIQCPVQPQLAIRPPSLTGTNQGRLAVPRLAACPLESQRARPCRASQGLAGPTRRKTVHSRDRHPRNGRPRDRPWDASKVNQQGGGQRQASPCLSARER